MPRKKLDQDYETRRHDFIIQMYKMSVTDWDRNLSNGWQTIATVAASTALLGLADTSSFPFPLRIAVAVAVTIWGLWNIIEADFWTRHAIGFLANIESIYLNIQDRTHIHPYIGQHPSSNFTESLGSQLGGIIVIFLSLFIYYLYRLLDYLPSFEPTFRSTLATLPLGELISWMTPLGIFLIALPFLINKYYSKLNNYMRFIKSSPGAGLLKDSNLSRSIRLNDKLTKKQIESGVDVQNEALEIVEKQLVRWKKINNFTFLTIGILVTLFASFLLTKPQL